MELEVKSFVDGEIPSGSISLSDQVFGQEFNESLVHQIVVAYLAGGRQGSKGQKTRAEVRGGGKKPWRQKGSGRARAGSSRSPLWRSGGKSFAATPRDHGQKVNRKMYRAALRSIFSELVRQERVTVLADFSLESPKTKNLLEKLSGIQEQKILIVTLEFENNLYLASRNLIGVDVLEADSVDPVSLVGSERILVTLSALKKIEEALA
ncbi:MAG: 50S ribosomal protein L4 [Pseudomonadales bacterium]|jgi:large subunit ribosomal protein L4|nr:50S ribosomal protein L4 [Pseudomonadales bacterium]HNI72099.1 50S ribosomal protein L4 [Accumulibacter sp.]HNW13847.1 50S ribosomal protein L4 [Anaerolineaceae bacterium]MCP5332270.1 50S ribosomal protein L4 [Pseudomonadales bacterium]HMU90749.1 50S ribosomal protein L4 [Pseudomonadales bacterium]